MFSREMCETFKNTFFYRTPLMADSGNFTSIIQVLLPWNLSKEGLWQRVFSDNFVKFLGGTLFQNTSRPMLHRRLSRNTPVDFMKYHELFCERLPSRIMNVKIMMLLITINLFHTTGLFRYPLKTSENLWFSNVIRGV